MAKKKKFVKCGEKAYGFACAFSQFNISRGQVKELDTLNKRRSNKIKRAILGGHLVEVPESEFEAYQKKMKKVADGVPEKTKDEEPKEPTLKETLSEKTKAELSEYYQDNYEVSEEDIAAFAKLKHDDMVDELVDLAEE